VAPPVPSNTELEILHVLWNRGPSTVRQVFDVMRKDRDVGYTTVLKIMQVMAAKKLVKRDESDRSHIYTPAVEEKSVKRKLVADLLDRAFDGSAAGLVMHALSGKKASREELEQIRRLLDEQDRRK
jgi:BlaI family penicillinase repressor